MEYFAFFGSELAQPPVAQIACTPASALTRASRPSLVSNLFAEQRQLPVSLVSVEDGQDDEGAIAVEGSMLVSTPSR